MNYASQLKGWAIDRVTEAHKAGVLNLSGVSELSAAADDLAKACYIADTDFHDTVQHLSQLIKNLPDPLPLVQGLISELQLVEEDIERQSGFKKAVNGETHVN